MLLSNFDPCHLASIPPHRTVVSFAHGADISNRVALFKFLLSSGESEILFLPMNIAFSVRNRLVAFCRRTGRPGTVPRADDTGPDADHVHAFHDNMPSVQPDDFRSNGNFVLGSEAYSYDDRLYLVWHPARAGCVVHRLAWPIVPFLMAVVSEFERDGDLVNNEALRPPSTRIN